MDHAQLLNHFVEHYLTRREIGYRLPVSLSIKDFWPELLAFRKQKSETLPLFSASGEPYWYARTKKLLSDGDKIAAMARRDLLLELPQYQTLIEDGLLDEAYFSSLIEGAATTRQQARAFLKSGAEPSDQSERMILNNYRALDYILGNLDMPIDEAIILQIASILTEGTPEHVLGYRTERVQVVSGRQEIVYVAPPADAVRFMMDQLIAFIADSEIHPVLKACITHIVFVTIHPFVDGNGRTARALSYMILLQAGYDFFRQFPISGLIAQERPRYYKAIRDTQSPDNNCDLTYFMEYYTGMLARSVDALNEQVTRYQSVRQLLPRLQDGADVPQRLIDGTQWLLSGESKTITAETWRRKFDVSFETARKDLQRLESVGIIRLRVQGRKHIYDILPQ